MAHLFSTLCGAFLLHPFPFGQNILYVHLPCNLFFHGFVLGNQEADLPVGLLRKNRGQSLRRLCSHHLLFSSCFALFSHLLHNRFCSVSFTGVFSRFLLGSIWLCGPRRYRSGNIRSCVNLLQFFSGSIFLRGSARLAFNRERSFLQLIQISCFPEEYFRVLQHLPFAVPARTGGFLLLAGISGRLSVRAPFLRILFFLAAGIFILSGVFFRKDFFQPLRQLSLEIDCIILPHIHGLHLDIQLFFVPGQRVLIMFPGTAFPVSFLRSIALARLCVSAFRYIALAFPAVLQSLIALFLSCLRRQIFLRLVAFLKSAVIFFLLFRRQGLMEHFQLHGLNYILPLTEPQDQFITLLHTAGR